MSIRVQRVVRRRWFHFAALALGVGVLLGVTKFVGTATVGAHLAQALPWLALLFVLEGARVPLEAIATRRLLGARGERVSLAELSGAQLLSARARPGSTLR